MRALVLALA
jgi:hypothetical protein